VQITVSGSTGDSFAANELSLSYDQDFLVEPAGIAGAKRLGSRSGSSSGASPASADSYSETIEATAAHPIWVVGKGWLDTGALEVGNKLLAKDGSHLTITKLGLVKKQVRVYNFEVAKLHTYFVGGQQQWLVHNINCGALYGDTNTPGRIDYGTIDPTTGQRSGTRARITPDMVGGPRSEASRSFDPLPGWIDGFIHNRAHLHGSQLGGSGGIASNLVTMLALRNSPVMRRFENSVRRHVQAGNVVYYFSEPVYATAAATGAPIRVTLRARGSNGFRLNVTIRNT
jgi:hypothetical protein